MRRAASPLGFLVMPIAQLADALCRIFPHRGEVV
jgi:hypothetical protein